MRRIKDFLEAYVEYAYGQESPEIFHLWCAIGIIASSLERNVYIDRSYYILYPNLYMVLVGNSALARRSTALGMAADILHEAAPDIPILPDKTSAEALIVALQESFKERKISSGVVIADELGVFLGEGDSQSIRLVKILTELYMCKKRFEARTITRGIDICENVCINLLGSTTPDWATPALPSSSIAGGFTGRVIFVHQPDTLKRIAFPEISKKQVDARDDIIHDLKEIHSLRGPFTISPEGRRWFEKWYTEVWDPDSASPPLRPYFGRKPDMVLKVAMIRSVSLSNTLSISEHNLEDSCRYLTDNEKYLPELMSVVQASEEGQMAMRIHRLITKRGRVTYSELLRSVSYFLRAKELGEILDSLIQADLIQMVVEGRSRVYISKRSFGF